MFPRTLKDIDQPNAFISPSQIESLWLGTDTHTSAASFPTASSIFCHSYPAKYINPHLLLLCTRPPEPIPSPSVTHSTAHGTVQISPCVTGSSKSHTTAPPTTDGRSNPASPPFREPSPRHSIASQGRLSFHKAPDVPTPASTPSVKS